MLKNLCILWLGIAMSLYGYSQCLTPPPVPSCNGTEPLLTDGDNLPVSSIKWYYGTTTTFNSVIIDGGTLIVCGNLTIDKLYMNTGKIFIRPGARLVIGSGIGAGLQFKGDCAIYNYGTCEIQRNLTLENNATAATPNIVMNALPTSVFLMSNQYFVISNAHSWFVNNGTAEFWGIINDNQSSANSVCLGSNSNTKMAVLINKVANTYSVPSGAACLNVFQFSEFYGQLSSSPNLMVCLGSSHTSSSSCIPFGCRPNYWGASQIFNNCSSCATINTALPINFISLEVTNTSDGYNKLHWKWNSELEDGNFTVLHSADGNNFSAIDSVTISPTNTNVAEFSSFHKNPLPKTNYYMIRYKNIRTGLQLNSRIVKIISAIKSGVSVYPVPFLDKFFINYESGTTPREIKLKNAAGNNVRILHKINKASSLVEITVLDRLNPGIYFIYLQTDKSIITRPTMKY